MSKHPKPRLTPGECHWRRIVADWRESGLTAPEFCADKDIKIGTFYVWCNKLKKIDAALEVEGEEPPPPLSVVPVELLGTGWSEPESEPLEIQLSGGDTIRVPAHANLSQVEQIVAILRREWP